MNKQVLLATLFALMISLFGCDQNPMVNVPIEFSELPAKAQTTVNTHFTEEEFSYATKRNTIVPAYDVYFNSGNKIEFDSKGEWEEISCINSKVPNSIVPNPILVHTQKYFPQDSIILMEHSTYHYDILLSNRAELTFDNNFQLEDFDKNDPEDMD